ncbi:efflux RND transporter periplasmic adaptor subunit [Niabella aquatica]
MKIIINILFLITITVLFNSCVDRHTEIDSHAHDDSESRKGKASTEEHSEDTRVVAALTGEQMKAIGLELGVIQRKELTDAIRVNGILKVPNNNKGNATSLYGGVIQKMNVEIGDYVRKGQVVATIVNPQFIQMQEEYLSVNSKIMFADQELQRQQELNEGNAGAKRNLQSAIAELSALRTRRASLYRQLQMMGFHPGSITNSNMRTALAVKSPVSGTVSNVFTKIGSYVDVSSPVIEVVDNSSLHLDLQVFEKDLPKMKVGQVIHFTITNNPVREYDAKVFSIGSTFENESKTIAVHCAVTGNKAGLIDGMNVTGLVSLDNITSPAVPSDAIVEADGKYYIFIQTNKMHPAEREKAPGHNDHANDKNGAEYKDEKKTGQYVKEREKVMHFEKIEIIKGVSDLGYTAITFVDEVPDKAKVVTKGAFFINAKLSNTGGHEH